jgi:hypothetical protein
MVVFVGSPLHVKNPYLRAKFVEILADWLPERCPPGTTRNIMTGLFEGHPLAIQVLVPNLLRLYVDIEFTGSHTQVKCLELENISNRHWFCRQQILKLVISEYFLYCSPRLAT